MHSVDSTRTVPAFLSGLAQLLRDAPFDDVGPACAWLGIPLADDCPTPGQARAWARDEWNGWAKKNGFEWDGEATHAWMWRHKLANTLVISVAKTPGDIYTPMAQATQTRRMVREMSITCNVIMRDVCLKGVTSTDWLKLDEAGFRREVIRLAQDKNPEAKHYVASLTISNPTSGRQASKTIQDLMNLLERIKQDFGIPPREVIDGIAGSAMVAAGLGWEQIKMIDPMKNIPTDLVDIVKDHLEELRERERAEKDQKRQMREKEEQERERRKADKNRVKTPKEILAEQLAARDAETRRNLQAVANAAMSTLDRVRLAEAQLKPVELPEFEDTAPLKAELVTANRNLEDTKTALVAVSQSRQDAVDELAALAKKMTPERMKHLEEVEENLSTFAAMVVEAVASAATVNPFQMVGILNSLSDQAKTFVKKKET